MPGAGVGLEPLHGLVEYLLQSRHRIGVVAVGRRAVFLGSAALTAVLTMALRKTLPQHAPTTSLPYHHVLRSIARLVRTHPVLMRRGLHRAAMFGAFFVGGAAGSQLGSVVHHAGDWSALTVLGAALPLAALLYRAFERRTRASVGAGR